MSGIELLRGGEVSLCRQQDHAIRVGQQGRHVITVDFMETLTTGTMVRFPSKPLNAQVKTSIAIGEIYLEQGLEFLPKRFRERPVFVLALSASHHDAEHMVQLEGLVDCPIP
ncbi:hypothetical protein J2S28_004857 [Rhizobium sp. SLBN-94]|nr:hypothetical protein [Rhizobium sp. SLBN-94]